MRFPYAVIVAASMATTPVFAQPASYVDAVGDIDASILTGGGTLDIVDMEVSETTTDLVFTLTVNGNVSSTDWGKFMIGIANSKLTGTTTGNGWGRPINMDSPGGGMSRWIGSWVDGGGGAQLFSYNGTTWSQAPTGPGLVLTPGTQSTIEYTVTKASLDYVDGDVLYFDAYSSVGGGGDSAVDALSNPNVAITGWGGPYTSQSPFISRYPALDNIVSSLEEAATKSPFDPATVANWNAGGAAWTVDTSVTHDGVDSVKAQTTDGQSTYREYTVTGPAVVDFWWKVSSQQGADYFSYSLNGVSREAISGEVNWTSRTLQLPEGTHTIRWSYTKDGSGSVGQDAGWLDELRVRYLSPGGDEDSDGLNNAEETNLGTNPYQRDTDSDGVNDLREVGDGTDPLNPASFDPLNLGLVAYFPFNGNVKDESGNANHGSANGSHAFPDGGISGKAFRGNGDGSQFYAGGGFVSLPSFKAEMNDAMTLSFWVSDEAPSSGPSGNEAYFSIDKTDLSSGLGWRLEQFYVNEQNPPYVAVSLVSHGSGGVDIRDSVPLDEVFRNRWKHFVVVKTGSSITWFRDGIRIGSAATANAIFPAERFVFNHHVWTVGGSSSRMSATYDDVRVYDRVFDEDEVRLLYASARYDGAGLEDAATKSPFDPATAANWSAGGTEWTVDTSVTHDGVDSVKAQTTDGQSTYREYTVIGPAVVDFWWKVSSEELYDTFSWSVNGVNQQTISGEVDWTYRTLTLPEGSHTIRWTYTKDESGAVGQDAGWLDDFVVYPATATLQVRDGSTVLNDEATVDFGSADTGSTGFTRSLTFANEGYVPLEVELSLPEGSPFAFDDGAATYELLVGRGESVDVPIVLSTAGAGTKTAQLTISAPDSTVVPPSVTLTGYVRGPDIGLAQGTTALTSGQTFDMGLAPRTVEFTIRNNGNVGDLVIAGISATGNLQITQQPATTIPPQTSTTFKVLAQSVASGVQAGSISITSNAANLAEFSLPLSSKSLIAFPDGVADGSMATSGTGGAVGWDFATTVLPSGQSGQALKTGVTPGSGGSVLEFTTQTAGVVSWTWKVSTQENFDWLLCEVDGQEAAGISTKNGVWQTQVVQVPAGANVRWVYRKDASGNIGEDAGYLADLEFRSLAANQSFSQWAQTQGIYDPQQRMPKSGLQAMFGWLGGFGADEVSPYSNNCPFAKIGSQFKGVVELGYRFLISKTADGTQQILYSSDMGTWTTRRISQRIVGEDADRLVIEATALSGTKGFFKVVGGGDTSGLMVRVQGGTLPENSELAGNTVSAFQIGKTEVTLDEWQEVRAWAVANGYSDLVGVGAGSSGDAPIRNVNWYDVVKWCNAKSEKDGLAPVYLIDGAVYRTGHSSPSVTSSANGHRLPTEAEWEWAARGGASSQGYTYSGSNDVNAVAWYIQNSGYSAKAVATKAANELGIHDMSGNVWEWCEDSDRSTGRRIRGGGADNEAGNCAVRARSDWNFPDHRSNQGGFRLARNAD